MYDVGGSKTIHSMVDLRCANGRPVAERKATINEALLGPIV